MEKTEQTHISNDTLIYVLTKALNIPIINASYETTILHGGTVGNVQLVAGIANTSGGMVLPYKVVLKIQKKWGRHGDSESWRREYDLYLSDFREVLTEIIRWPECYHLVDYGEETQIWMEFVEGVSGGRLTIEMLEYVAEELGRYQARIHTNPPDILKNINCLSGTYFKKEYFEFRYNEVCEHITPEDCAVIPLHLREMFADAARNAGSMIMGVERLPVTLCHHDVWHENIFLSDGIITLIDWDCAGWDFIGYDAIQLIGEMFVDFHFSVEQFEEYSRRLLAAYLKGVSEYMDAAFFTYDLVRNIFILWLGHMLFWKYKYADDADIKTKSLCIDILQKIYEMRNNAHDHY